MGERLVSVALPLPVQTAFSYRLPGHFPDAVCGSRVLVPFGSRRVIGVVLGRAAEAVRGLKDVLEVLDEAPVPPTPLLDVAAFVADHYLAPPGECYRLVLPPAGVRGSRRVVRLADGSGVPADPILAELRQGPLSVAAVARRLGKDPTARLLRLQRSGAVIIEPEVKTPGFRHARVVVLEDGSLTPRGKAQAAVLRLLEEAGGRLRLSEILKNGRSLGGAVRRLAEVGALRLEEERWLRHPERLEGGQVSRPSPTVDQARVLDPILEALSAHRFAPFLLHGITGSGKTEVYFRATERALELGRGAVILVPEIALTPLLVRSAVARFGSAVAVLHSELSLGERHDQWWRIRDGEARVVVGARSAVFAPMSGLGLLVVDEEHEAAYKQEESPRYHARDVALVRARLEGAVALLGSATPSVESYANALAGKYTRLVLADRIGPRGLPRIHIVDRRQVLKAGGDEILTPPLREALASRLLRGEQALLLLNRRGWATGLLCRECGVQAVCANCSVALVLHQRGGLALCHYCGYQLAAPTSCASCRGEYLRSRGYGTERVADAVRAAFPAARVDRLDRDRTSRRGVVARVLADFEERKTDVLVGTQMIAKGHDFPGVTLVGVIDADVGLGLPDFRSAERSFQLLTQVAGRAGRGDVAGEVILQSHLPDHYALSLACRGDYEAFFEREMEFRRTMAYPPAAALVNLVLRSRDARQAATAVDALGRRLREWAGGRYRVLGPARAPLARLRQEHRYQILLKGPRAILREAVRRALVESYGEVRWPGVAVDVDPTSVM